VTIITIVQNAADYTRGERLRVVADPETPGAGEIAQRQAEKLLQTGYARVGEVAVPGPAETAAHRAPGPRPPARGRKPERRG